MKFKTKYFGILKDFDTENVDKKTFMELINKNLFDEDKLDDEQIKEERKHELEYPNPVFSLESFFYFMFLKSYFFKNDIYKEMEEMDNNLIVYFSDAEKIILEIDFEIEKQFTQKRKTEIIENYYKNYFSLIQNDDINDYLLYVNGTNNNDIESWSDLYRENLTGTGNVKPLIDFLKGKSYFYNKDLKNSWELIYKVSKICAFCKSKINNIEFSAVHPKTTVPPGNEKIQNLYSSIVFINDNAETLFKYIVSQCPDKKNTAFFSYLYFYFKDVLKLLQLQNDNDSKDYRNYVIEEYGINYAKIQSTNSARKFKKENMDVQFKKHVSRFNCT